MPRLTFEELWGKGTFYFGKAMVEEWGNIYEHNKQSRGGDDFKEALKRKCERCVSRSKNNQNDSWGIVGELIENSQLAFLWAYCYEKINHPGKKNTDFSATENYYREQAKDFLLAAKTYLLQKMQNAAELKTLIEKKAFLCVDLSGISFQRMKFEGADFRHSDLSKTSFNNCNIQDADFSDADLTGADFTEILARNVLNSQKVYEAQKGFFGVNLERADLSNAKYKHADIMTAKNLHLTRFGDLPASYKESSQEKQALEDKIRQSYEDVTDGKGNRYNPIFLKLIQASGFSPLTWGDLPSLFEREYTNWVNYDAELLLGTMQKKIGIIVDAKDVRGYEQGRTKNPLKFFAPKRESRAGQITALTTLKDKQDLTIGEVADKLLEVSNVIRREPNKLYSELLSQIEQTCQHEESKGPVLTN